MSDHSAADLWRDFERLRDLLRAAVEVHCLLLGKRSAEREQSLRTLLQQFYRLLCCDMDAAVDPDGIRPTRQSAAESLFVLSGGAENSPTIRAARYVAKVQAAVFSAGQPAVFLTSTGDLPEETAKELAGVLNKRPPASLASLSLPALEKELSAMEAETARAAQATRLPADSQAKLLATLSAEPATAGAGAEVQKNADAQRLTRPPRKQRRRKPNLKAAERRKERARQGSIDAAIHEEWSTEQQWTSYQDYINWKSQNLPKGWPELTRRYVERAVDRHRKRLRRQGK